MHTHTRHKTASALFPYLLRYVNYFSTSVSRVKWSTRRQTNASPSIFFPYLYLPANLWGKIFKSEPIQEQASFKAKMRLCYMEIAKRFHALKLISGADPKDMGKLIRSANHLTAFGLSFFAQTRHAIHECNSARARLLIDDLQVLENMLKT